MEGVGCGPDGYRKEGGGGLVQLCADVAQLCSVCSESEQTVST